MTPTRARPHRGPSLCMNLLATALLALAASACGAREAPAAGAAASASGGLPKEVQAFVARRQQCDHFRGEEASDPKRQAFLDAKLKETCGGTDKQLAELRKRYKTNKAVTKALSGFDDTIE